MDVTSEATGSKASCPGKPTIKPNVKEIRWPKRSKKYHETNDMGRWED